MRTTLIAKILTLLILLSFKITNAQIQSNHEILGSKVLDALITNNYNTLEDYLPTMSDFEEMIEKISSFFPVEKQREMISTKNEFAKSSIKILHESFNSVYQDGVSAGINWAKVKFKSISTEYVGENPIPKELITGVNIKFTYLGVEYSIDVFSSEIKRGYILVDRFKFY